MTFATSRLIEATAHGDVRTIKCCIAAGVDVNSCDENGELPLVLAVGAEQVESVKVLLASGANPRARNKEGFSALFVSCETGSAAVVKILLATEARADIDELLLGFEMGGTPLGASAGNGHKECVELLVEAGCDLDKRGENGYSACHWCCMKGSHDVLKVLTGANADVNVRGNDLMSPLDIASLKGLHECVYLLLCAKADVSAKGPHDFTPLHQAAAGEHPEVIETLLSAGADRNIKDGLGRTPLILACVRGDAKSVALLIDAGSDLNKGHALETNALFHACSVGVVRVLIERGCSAKALDKHGRTVLHHAGIGGADTATICALYKAGADPTSLDWVGKTAADCARQFGHTDTAKLLDLLAAKYRELRRLEAEKACEEKEASSVHDLSEKVNSIDISEKQEQK